MYIAADLNSINRQREREKKREREREMKKFFE
jgi:hypothetical protein